MAHPDFPASCSSPLPVSDSSPGFITDAPWDTSSDATLDDVQRPYCCFGVPLTRMVTFEYLSPSSSDVDHLENLEESECYVRDEEINLIEEDMSLFNLALVQRDVEGDPALRSTSHGYVHHVIDDMAPHTRGSSSPGVCMSYTAFIIELRYICRFFSL